MYIYNSLCVEGWSLVSSGRCGYASSTMDVDTTVKSIPQEVSTRFRRNNSNLFELFSYVTKVQDTLWKASRL